MHFPHRFLVRGVLFSGVGGRVRAGWEAPFFRHAITRRADVGQTTRHKDPGAVRGGC
jgi:hypothetical protein